MTFKTILLYFGLCGLVACSSGGKVSTEALIGTPQGPVQGVSTEDADIYNFKGLPFAQPPVGDLRWAAPKPAAKWNELKLADTFGNRCMQPTNVEGGFFNRLIEGHGLGKVKNFLIEKAIAAQKSPPMSEDCLYLNVRTGNLPRDNQEAYTPQPVMVWFHGGGHQFGSADTAYYQSNTLVKKDVVLVTINSRLGALGYMAHPALSDSDPRGVSGNYGTLDQIEALKWVRDNISAYGGDTENVTIFGESAGSWSVTEMMASPLAKGLFHKAIGQSGAASYHLGQMEGGDAIWPSGYTDGKAFVSKLDLKNPTAEQLRAVPTEAIATAISKDAWGRFYTLRDGVVFPENIGTAFAQGKFNAVPMLFGYNADEGTLFFPDNQQPTAWLDDFPSQNRQAQIDKLSGPFPTQAKTLVDLYNLDTKFTQGGSAMMGDETFGANIRFVTRQNEAEGQDSYLYFFSRIPPSRKQTIGAFHAAEIPFVFGSHESILGVSSEDKALSNMMQSYWTNFAKTSNPNGEGLPGWPLHKSEHWMHLTANTGETSGPITHVRKAKLDALEEGLLIKLEALEAAQNPPPSAGLAAAPN